MSTYKHTNAQINKQYTNHGQQYWTNIRTAEVLVRITRARENTEIGTKVEKIKLSEDLYL